MFIQDNCQTINLGRITKLITMTVRHGTLYQGPKHTELDENNTQNYN